MIVGLDFNFVRLLDKIELNVYVNEPINEVSIEKIKKLCSRSKPAIFICRMMDWIIRMLILLVVQLGF